MSETGNLHWYVLRTIRGQENKIKLHIETEAVSLGLKEHVSQLLIPIEKVFQIRNGKKIIKEKIFYPGYLFVEADISLAEVKHLLRQTPGVLGFLGSSGEPAPLRPNEIMRLLGKMDELIEKEEEVVGSFMIGESIIVIDGPFNSFTGIIEEINHEKKKLKVTVKIFGRKTPLELNFSQVEKES
ncbi:MAG: transcription termination/antitermination protein NusG [Bacteroidales bacterium]|jgi:transcriptional antiterminator NusG|nr:transcription termination/antitermination protein NusG [Bacteroidales bacterium]